MADQMSEVASATKLVDKTATEKVKETEQINDEFCNDNDYDEKSKVEEAQTFYSSIDLYPDIFVGRMDKFREDIDKYFIKRRDKVLEVIECLIDSKKECVRLKVLMETVDHGWSLDLKKNYDD